MLKDLIKIVKDEEEALNYIAMHQKDHNKELKYMWQHRPDNSSFIIIYVESEDI